MTMSRTGRLAVVAMLFATPVLAAAAEAPKDDAKVKAEVKKLQGTWNFTAVEIDGTKFEDKAFKGSRITLKGDTFTTVSMGAIYKGTFKVDVASTPKKLDMTFTEGPPKGTTSLGIYELDGDTWKVCVTLNATERPKAFATKAGSGLALETLRREADEKADDAAKKEVAKLEGEWSMVSGEIGGQAMPDAMVKTGKRVCKGDETTTTFGGRLFMKATFTVDPSKKPMTIDYKMTEGTTKGKTQLGIYEWDGDTVRFCFSAPGKERPTDFKTKEGDDRVLSVWKKAKP
jgi:uncharacterized protein (TIGR03067 family)